MARKTREEAAGTRNRIVDAAERVFREKGVAHASLEDVAAAARVYRRAEELGLGTELSLWRKPIWT